MYSLFRDINTLMKPLSQNISANQEVVKFIFINFASAASAKLSLFLLNNVDETHAYAASQMLCGCQSKVCAQLLKYMDLNMIIMFMSDSVKKHSGNCEIHAVYQNLIVTPLRS